ncbi:MAG TPA: adenosylcobalamin-dependent ribonucleoside-diphosphate reductase, partial [Hyphomicrobiaceae bacterium]|nr:adenosylcobalamin-dependent ribonucleoside-diphosphate reductase [Hyphomicrobiaceae bacterium]
MGRIEDDLTAIFEAVKEAALTMQQGGGVGMDFSTLRPAGALVRSIGADASGPVSFMDVWDAMCRTIMSAGHRRGAMMATLRCDHPDIEAFIEAKRDSARLRNFNLSVLVSDAFMAAVAKGDRWALTFGGREVRSVNAPSLWDRLMRATYDVAEPGVIFIDRINRRNNLAYCERIAATNPCGEQPLPPYGACLLGSINLARLVTKPFEREARIDLARLERLTRDAVRFLDNIIDVSGFPLEPQRREALAKRRLGLGVTGLADALAMCGLGYGDAAAARLAAGWMAAIQGAAYEASAELAGEKGAFPLFEAAPFLAAPAVAALPESVRQSIRRHGIRNGCLTSIAPTGTISLLAGNVSSGIEPIFDLAYTRRVRQADGAQRETNVEDWAVAEWKRLRGPQATLPPAFVTAGSVNPRGHLEMQAALQPHVDGAISKTINCPVDMPFESFRDIYSQAYELGLKGCTTFRPNAITGSVLETLPQPVVAPAPPVAAIVIGSSSAPVIPPTPEQVPGVGGSAGRTPGDMADIHYMSRPLARDDVLPGFTYKLRWPGSDHAIYVTINDIIRDGRRRPFEIFINTKNLEHYAWMVALTRMISAVFRRGGDVSFIAEELGAIFDPQGGRWMDGHYVPSLQAAIGNVIDDHMRRIGALSETEHKIADDARAPQSRLIARGDATDPAADGVRAGPARSFGSAGPGEGDTSALAGSCRRCGANAVVRDGRCWVCRNCGYARCG